RARPAAHVTAALRAPPLPPPAVSGAAPRFAAEFAAHAPPASRRVTETAPTAPTAPPPVAPAPPATAARRSAVDEFTLLHAARAALGARAPARALALLDAHAARYPNGVLRIERVAARIDALCALGRSDEAYREAEHHASELARSPYADRVRAACT